MTLQEIKDQVALQYGFEDWLTLATREFIPISQHIHDLVTKRYATAMIEEDRKDAAFQLTGKLFAEGFAIPDSKVLPHIHDRPLPDLK